MPYSINTPIVLHITVDVFSSFRHHLNQTSITEELISYKWHPSYNVLSTNVLQWNSTYAMIFQIQFFFI